MPHSVKYNSKTDIVEMIVEGEFTFDVAKNILSEAKDMFLQYRCHKFLTDYRNAVLSVNTFDLYNFAEMISDEMSAVNLPIHKIKRAVIAGPELADYKFLETLSLNRGQRIRVFEDPDEAVQWLREDKNHSL